MSTPVPKDAGRYRSRVVVAGAGRRSDIQNRTRRSQVQIGQGRKQRVKPQPSWRRRLKTPCTIGKRDAISSRSAVVVCAAVVKSPVMAVTPKGPETNKSL